MVFCAPRKMHIIYAVRVAPAQNNADDSWRAVSRYSQQCRRYIWVGTHGNIQCGCGRGTRIPSLPPAGKSTRMDSLACGLVCGRRTHLVQGAAAYRLIVDRAPPWERQGLSSPSTRWRGKGGGR